MANDQQVAILKQGVAAWNQWRSQHPDVAIDLFGIDLTGIDLHGANLSGADLSGEELRGANLQGADLSGANLKGTDLCEANLSGANLSNADLSGTDLTKANLSKTNLEQANLNEVDLTKANLKEANFAKSYLDKAILNGADFTKANLSKANLFKAELGGAILRKAILVETGFYRANLFSANFQEAELLNANFARTNLDRTDFSGSNLCGVNFARAAALKTDFSNADLTGICTHDWNINKDTDFTNVKCQFIYRGSIWKKNERRVEYLDRVPATGEFAPGDFQKLFQQAINTVDLIFRHGIDWQAFNESFLNLQSETGAELSIRAIETRDDGSFVIRINVPTDAIKAEIEEFIYSKYKTALKQQTEKYKAILAAKNQEIAKNEEIIDLYREKSADLKEIVLKMAESQPVFNNANTSTNTNIGHDQNTNATNSIVAGQDISGDVDQQIDTAKEPGSNS
jgi:uncharacterized protein YjbI with pentapeptide repeats